MSDALSPYAIPHDPHALRARHADDAHRPRFHFCAPSNWMNDPNGLIWWRGAYHLFYQYNPLGAYHHHVHWGHAISTDLITWRDLPIALSPDPDGIDRNGCWSGCAVPDGDTVRLFYTSAFPQAQSTATAADPDLIVWHKHPANPIIPAPPPDLPLTGGAFGPDFRDPFVWREGEFWYMVLAVGIVGVGGGVLLYRSADLLAWEYVGVAHSGQIAPGATIWECPNLFALDGAHVLLVSELPDSRHTFWRVGTFADHAFTARATGVTDAAPYVYAALTMEDAARRRLFWGWIKEGLPRDAQREQGWSGALTVPRVLSVRDDTLRQQPAPELTALRGALLADRPELHLEVGESILLTADGRHAEVEVTLDAAASVTLRVLASPDEREFTHIDYDGVTGLMLISTHDASLNPIADRLSVTHPHTPAGETMTLRAFVDGSIVEVFVDDTTVLTVRAYPTLPGSTQISVHTVHTEARLHTCRVWEMGSIFG
jgi:beta-fructofuranosidase